MKRSVISRTVTGLLAAFPLTATTLAIAADPPANIVTAPAAASTTTSPANPPKIDPAAMALLKTVSAKMLALKSYQARCDMKITWSATATRPERSSYHVASLVEQKPDRMHYSEWFTKESDLANPQLPDRAADDAQVANGGNVWLQFGKMYRTRHNDPPSALFTLGLEPWDGFFSAEVSPTTAVASYLKKGKLFEVRQDGSEAVKGVPCQKVFVHGVVIYENAPMDYQTTWFIGINDNLVHRRLELVSINNGPPLTYDATLRDIQVNAPIPQAKTLFVYTPPKGVVTEEEAEKNRPVLLANGTMAPDFTAVDKTGSAVKLSNLRGKVVVVDFWASWCGPCVASMPHAQEVVKKLQAENVPVVLLAVDNSEEMPAFTEWVKAHSELDALHFVFADRKTTDISSKSYHVSVIPTQYIIDPEGKIRTSSVGYGGPTDVLEKAIRAAAQPLAAK